MAVKNKLFRFLLAFATVSLTLLVIRNLHSEVGDFKEELEKATVMYEEVVKGDMTKFNWNTTLPFPRQVSNTDKTINIGMIFTNIQWRFIELKVALDSLMLHRSCHVNFLFGVDGKSKEWVEAYFKLRQYSSTEVHFHSLQINDERVKQAMESPGFGSGTAVYKIHADQIFQKAPDVFLLDFDILINRDICLGYEEMKQQLKKEDKMILAGGEMSTWYDRVGGMQPKIGPVLPKEMRTLWDGLNTGTVFYDLRQMRAKGWTTIWLEELHSGRFPISEYLKLGEQSLINAIALNKPEIFGFLPYGFNFQLLDSHHRHVNELFIAWFDTIYVIHEYVVWLLHNPMHTGSFPSFIKSGEITIENYKQKKMVIWWYLHKKIW